MAPNTLEIPSVYDIIQELQELSGGGKTQTNIARGMTSLPTTPAAAARRSAAPMTLGAPSPAAANPLSSLGWLASLMQPLLKPGEPPADSFVITNPAVAPVGAMTPELSVPGMAAGPAAPGAAAPVAGPAAAATSGSPLPVPFASYYANQAIPGSPLPAGIAAYLRNQFPAAIAPAAGGAAATFHSILAGLGLI
jgi:hypothetical protein